MTLHATHSIVCRAAPERVHGLVARAADWPGVLSLCESVTVLETRPGEELIEITARVDGRARSWRTRRRVRPEVLGVDATMVTTMPLVASMSTRWRVVDLGDGRCLLLLEHDYELVDDVAGAVPGVDDRDGAARWVAGVLDANTTTELAELRAAAERDDPAARTFHARHSVVCPAPADAVYPLIRETDRWPGLFPACLGAGVVGGDGRTEDVRIEADQDGRRVAWVTRRTYADAIRRIDYELPVPMPMLEAMSGVWRVVALGEDACLLTVDREWRVLPDVTGIRPDVTTVAEAAAVVARFVDTNAATEMAVVRDLVSPEAVRV